MIQKLPSVCAQYRKFRHAQSALESDHNRQQAYAAWISDVVLALTPEAGQ
jgi:hypothetical protein